MGKPRLHTDADGYFAATHLWHLLIRRLDLEYRKLLADNPAFSHDRTAVVEFSRGAEHGGFREAFQHFSDELLSRAAILYLDVSYEESLRKNRRRFNPDRPHSILEHALPDDKLERLYGKSDWEELASGSEGFIQVRDLRVPFAVFHNEDDVTTPGGEPLANRLADRLKRLFHLSDS
ncbi:MAG: hypothetical protein E4H09_04850 [Spirochaetales bacterium]|nr:MAG: hypothetical protein E4H09_04850 [Spirochaetales bacterium]